MQFLLTHLSDKDLQQAADEEQGIVGLPDEQLTVRRRGEEKEKEKEKESSTAYNSNCINYISITYLGLVLHKYDTKIEL